MSRQDGRLGPSVFIALLAAGCATGAPGGGFQAEIYWDAATECESRAGLPVPDGLNEHPTAEID